MIVQYTAMGYAEKKEMEIICKANNYTKYISNDEEDIEENWRMKIQLSDTCKEDYYLMEKDHKYYLFTERAWFDFFSRNDIIELQINEVKDFLLGRLLEDVDQQFRDKYKAIFENKEVAHCGYNSYYREHDDQPTKPVKQNKDGQGDLRKDWFDDFDIQE